MRSDFGESLPAAGLSCSAAELIGNTAAAVAAIAKNRTRRVRRGAFMIGDTEDRDRSFTTSNALRLRQRPPLAVFALEEPLGIGGVGELHVLRVPLQPFAGA